VPREIPKEIPPELYEVYRDRAMMFMWPIAPETTWRTSPTSPTTAVPKKKKPPF
jgi:hypothetical protein